MNFIEISDNENLNADLVESFSAGTRSVPNEIVETEGYTERVVRLPNQQETTLKIKKSI